MSAPSARIIRARSTICSDVISVASMISANIVTSYSERSTCCLAWPKIFREIGNFFGSAFEPGSEKIRQTLEIAAKSPRHDDAIGASRKFQAAFDDVGCHQRGHLDTDVRHEGFHLIDIEFLGDALYARLRQRSGYEYDALGHRPAISFQNST